MDFERQRLQLPAVAVTPAVAMERSIAVRPPEPSSVVPAGVVHDGHTSPGLRAPYTFIIDGRIVARVRTDADTLQLRKIATMDPNSVESIEVMREADAKNRYPESVGNVIVIRLKDRRASRPR